MTETPVIMWFRNDLRLYDNRALDAALRSGRPIIPFFVFDHNILNMDTTGAPRKRFLWEALGSLDASLRELGSALWVADGLPEKAITDLTSRTGANAVYFNRGYSPYARQRDDATAKSITGPVHAFDDALLIAPGGVLKGDGRPYTVYTPFKKTWLFIEKDHPSDPPDMRGRFLAPPQHEHGLDRVASSGHDFTSAVVTPSASEAAARRRLNRFISGPIYAYDSGRNHLAIDPVTDPTIGSSILSPYFHMGMLSVREAFWAATTARDSAPDAAGRHAVEVWISELAWREFYQHILYHFPYVAKGNFRSVYDKVPWRNSEADLQAWMDGATGFPIIDAAMRQLRVAGWMPNRARMIVASFLSKNLLINWREGERHFMRWLVDGDLAANNGGWQWAAGTGTDAQPYFRIFNPMTQSKKFDPDGAYIRRWVPELRDLSLRDIHEPWKADAPPRDYPPPIVDYAMSRQRALDAYGMARE